jgi:hypothetical protein
MRVRVGRAPPGALQEETEKKFPEESPRAGGPPSGVTTTGSTRFHEGVRCASMRDSSVAYLTSYEETSHVRQ